MSIEDWTPDPSGRPRAGESLRDTQPPAIDLAAALSGLDQATRNLTRRLGAAKDLAGTDQPHAAPPPAPRSVIRSDPAAASRATETGLELAEREAREYLQGARRRADKLLVTMLDAAERDVAALRREAEAEVSHRLRDARRVSEALVAERQRRLADLSDGIAGKAAALSAGLDDADRVRRQFDAFLDALSATADRIATDATASLTPVPPTELQDRGRRTSSGALAA